MSGNQTTPELTGINTNLLLICVISADVVAFINNVILLAIVIGTRLRDVTGLFIANQTLADAGVVLVMLSYSSVDYIRQHGGQVYLAVGWMRLFMFVFYSSSLQMLAAVACSLCVAICHPQYYTKLLTRKRVCVLIAVLWALNSGLGLLDLYSDTFTTSLALPHMFLADQHSSESWIVALDLATLLALPLIVAFISFVKIFCYTRTIGDLRGVNSKTTKHIRQAMSILVIGIVYMLTFMPVVVTQIVLKTRTAHSVVDSTVALSAVLINYSYLVIKLPLFLGLFRSYRDLLKQVLCCSRRSRVHNTSEAKVNTSEQQISAVVDAENKVNATKQEIPAVGVKDTRESTSKQRTSAISVNEEMGNTLVEISGGGVTKGNVSTSEQQIFAIDVNKGEHFGK